MLIALERLLGTAVMSLQTGVELARVNSVLIDPRNLTVVAYQLEGSTLVDTPSFLRPVDVRELSSLGLIVDSSDEFIGLDDVIKVKEVYDFGFNIIGLDVIDSKKKKLGKVASFTVDSNSFSIQQIIVKRPLLKSINESELLIHRSQITKVSNSHIIVQSATTEKPVTQSIREYANPFRNTNVQPEAIDFETRWP